jgi:hypothetical protein
MMPDLEGKDEQCSDVAEFLRILHSNGVVFEVRAPKCPNRKGGDYKSTAAGWFTNIDRAAYEIKQLEQLEPPGIYCTLNPVSSELLARSANRVQHQSQFTTKDEDITKFEYLFIDIDSIRTKGISATDAELAQAADVAHKIRYALLEEGCPKPLFGMSGNGYYLVLSVDLPNDEESKTLIQSCLKALAKRFNTKGAEVDTSTFNPSRIMKVLGTVARKGDAVVGVEGIEDRRHRRSWFIKPTEPLQVVSKEQLQRL